MVDNAIYRVCRIDPEGEQRWNVYAISLLLFSVAGFLLMYVLLRLQGHLPLNPDHQVNGVAPGLSFNTAVSFMTNTNWQVYAGESTMSQLSQMLALVVQQFLSAAVGMAVGVALIRGIVRKRQTTLGSFWVDTIRATTRILLPICVRVRHRVHVPGRHPELPCRQAGDDGGGAGHAPDDEHHPAADGDRKARSAR